MKVWRDLQKFTDKNNYAKKPIFLIGPPRCGTTLTYNILINHRDLCGFSAKDNQKIFDPEYLESQRKEIAAFREKGKRGGDGELNILYYGEKDAENSPAWKHFPDKSNLPIEGVHISNRFFGTAFDAKVDDNSKQFKDFVNIICKEKNKSRFVNKNPQNLKRVNALNELFPDSIFVCILRHPFFVIRSMINLIEKRLGNNFYLELPTIGVDIEKTNKIEYATLNLKQNIDLVFDFKHKISDQFYIFFYEDLIKNPKGEFKKLLKFLQVDEYPEFFQSFPKITDQNVLQKDNPLEIHPLNIWEPDSPNDIPSNKPTFSEQELSIISNILSNTMKRYNLPYDLKS